MAPGAPRPFVRINCAVSLDGRLAYAGGRRALLSGPNDLVRVQRMRAAADAILVGVGTVLADDPSLRVHWDLLHAPPGREPIRVVVDSRGRTPEHARVLTVPPSTVVATTVACDRPFPSGVDRFRAGTERVDLPALLAYLHGRGVRSLMVEGGAEILASFLRLGLVDELSIYVAPVVIGGRTAPSMVNGAETLGPDGLVRLVRQEAQPLDDGFLLTYARASGPPGRPPLGAPL